MKIIALEKMFGGVVNEVRDFYANNPVKLAKAYTNDPASTALAQLEPVKDVFESYAKKNGVSLYIDRASKLVADETKITPALKDLLDRSILLEVVDNMTGAESRAIIDAAKKFFVHSGSKYVTLPKNDKGAVSVLTHYSHEDNLIRAAYRIFEGLTKQVKK